MRIRQGIGRNSQSQILLILDAILRRHPAESAKPTATRQAETTARPPSAACECVMAYPLGSPPQRCSKWARGSLRLPWLNRSLFLILSIICSVLFTINMPQAQIKRAPASGPWDDRLGGVAGT